MACSAPGGDGRKPYNTHKSPHIPWIRGRDGRFCPFCGRPVSNFFDRDRCPHADCFQRFPERRPPLPHHLLWCASCKIVVLPKSFNFCPLCRWTTPRGRNWLHIVSEQRRDMDAIRRRTAERMQQLSDTDAPLPVNAARSSAAASQEVERVLRDPRGLNPPIPPPLPPFVLQPPDDFMDDDALDAEIADEADRMEMQQGERHAESGHNNQQAADEPSSREDNFSADVSSEGADE